jgi:hypothetical protein
MDVALALTVILNAVKDLLYAFDPSKQITSRFFVAEFILSMAEGLLRMTLRQVLRATGGKPTTPIFEGDESQSRFRTAHEARSRRTFLKGNGISILLARNRSTMAL